MAITTVYGLFSSRNNVIRYVGQTDKMVWERFSGHLQDAASDFPSEKARWMRDELKAGFLIHTVTMLEDCSRNIDERRMLDVYELSGHYLTNSHPGTEAHVDAQREGIKRAKFAGKYNGRSPSIDPQEVLSLHEIGVRPTEIARRLKIGRASVYRALNQLKLVPNEDGMGEQVENSPETEMIV